MSKYIFIFLLFIITTGCGKNSNGHKHIIYNVPKNTSVTKEVYLYRGSDNEIKIIRLIAIHYKMLHKATMTLF